MGKFIEHSELKISSTRTQRYSLDSIGPRGREGGAWCTGQSKRYYRRHKFLRWVWRHGAKRARARQKTDRHNSPNIHIFNGYKWDLYVNEDQSGACPVVGGCWQSLAGCNGGRWRDPDTNDRFASRKFVISAVPASAAVVGGCWRVVNEDQSGRWRVRGWRRAALRVSRRRPPAGALGLVLAGALGLRLAVCYVLLL